MALDKTKLAHALIAQQHQAKEAGAKLGEINNAIDALDARNSADMAILETAIASAKSALQARSSGGKISAPGLINELDAGTQNRSSIALIEEIDFVEFCESDDAAEFYLKICAYAERRNLTLPQDPFRTLMPIGQRIALEKRIREDFTLKNAQCDRYDYMIAATSGLIGGLIDVLFVGTPGNGLLGKFTDDATDTVVRKFARLAGWKGPRQGSDPTASAIGFLERKFKVNYDHRHGGDVDRIFRMSTKNHHIKSLAHSPDLVGLFFSILNQFTSTATFADNGKLITIDTETFELTGGNFVAKIFSGFVNWLGHLISDAAGSSGATKRGAGIPIPFYSLLQFANVGSFGKHRQSFAIVAVKVFEKGYDLRHGAAMAVPVVITELMSRIAWALKRRLVNDLDWTDCIPDAANPEMRRVLCVAHGSLCLVDGADASLRSGGTVIGFLLRANIIAWARFGVLSLKELRCLYQSGSIDVEAVDVYLEVEIQRLTFSR